MKARGVCTAKIWLQVGRWIYTTHAFYAKYGYAG